MKVKISYPSKIENKNIEAILELMAYAANGKPIAARFVTKNQKILRELTYNIPKDLKSGLDSICFRDAANEFLKDIDLSI